MALVLTPADVDGYGLGTVSQTDIDDAAERIHAQTSYSLAEHTETRGVSEGNARRAWAIVSARIRQFTSTDESRGLGGESQGDYSWSKAQVGGPAKSVYESLLAGTPWELLSMGTVSWFTVDNDPNAGLGFFDDYGVYFR